MEMILSCETLFESMSTQGEHSGTIVGQDDCLTDELQTMIQAFVGMVRLLVVSLICVQFLSVKLTKMSVHFGGLWYCDCPR